MSNSETRPVAALQGADNAAQQTTGRDEPPDWGYEAAMPYLTDMPPGHADNGATWAPHHGS